MESKIETNDHLRQIFEIIARAIDKGVGEDMRTYREENSTVTKNALPYVRIDKINTNLNEITKSFPSLFPVFPSFFLALYRFSIYTETIILFAKKEALPWLSATKNSGNSSLTRI